MSAAANDVYLGMRDLALKGHAPDGAPDPWAVLMDLSYPNAHVTVAAYHDGTASIYLGNGGGFLGGGDKNTAMNAAAKAAVTIAAEQLPLEVVTEHPLPPAGSVAFYVVCNAGVRAATVVEQSLRGGKEGLSRLYYAMQAIMTEYRLMSERGEFAP